MAERTNTNVSKWPSNLQLRLRLLVLLLLFLQRKRHLPTMDGLPPNSLYALLPLICRQHYLSGPCIQTSLIYRVRTFVMIAPNRPASRHWWSTKSTCAQRSVTHQSSCKGDIDVHQMKVSILGYLMVHSWPQLTQAGHLRFRVSDRTIFHSPILSAVRHMCNFRGTLSTYIPKNGHKGVLSSLVCFAPPIISAPTSPVSAPW